MTSQKTTLPNSANSASIMRPKVMERSYLVFTRSFRTNRLPICDTSAKRRSFDLTVEMRFFWLLVFVDASLKTVNGIGMTRR